MITQAPAINESPGDAETNNQMQEAASAGNPADVERLAGVQDVRPVEGHWTSAAKQTLIVEAIILIYGGALFILIVTYMSFTGIFGELYQLITREPFADEPYVDNTITTSSCSGVSTSPPTERNTQPAESNQREHARQPSAFTNVAFTLGYLAYIGTWLFWSGYVKLAGEMYCPPNLLYQGTVWVSMNVLGILLGAGF